MAERPGPVIVGPWLGEVGFELLYWAPFVAWCAQYARIAPERLLILSRGGTASWYAPFAGAYADVFDLVTTAEFRAEHNARVAALGEQKQTQATEFERRLVATTAARSGLAEWSWLHPSRMYALMHPYWWGHQDESWVHTHTVYRKLTPPEPDEVPSLPDAFVAVKFYFNDCFPPTEANQMFARQSIRRLVARGPVVALSTGLAVDDHVAASPEGLGVTLLPQGLDPAVNLAVQSAVVSRAKACVGTYGGFSYLAPFHGVPSYGYYSDGDGFSRHHLAVARSALKMIGSDGLLNVADSATGAEDLS